MRRPRLHIAGLRALQRAWCWAAPLLSHAGRLFRTRAAYSARGPPIPHAGRLSRTWAGLPRLGIAGPRADEKAAPKHAKHAKHEPQQHERPITPHVDLLGWKATLDPLGLRGLRDPAGHQIDRFEPQARGALTAGRTAPGSRARQCRCVQPSHRPPSYHPAQPSAGVLGPRRRGSQSRGSRATGG